MPVIEVVISPAGESRITTHGFAGATCRAADQFLREALGQSQREQLTAEFYQTSTTTTQSQQTD